MDDLTTDAGSTGDFSRRDALRRGALVVGAATLWTTPVVQTLGMRPAAAASPGDDPSDFCLDVGDPKNGQPRDMVYRYDARAFSEATNQQSSNYVNLGESGQLNPQSDVCIKWERTGPPATGYITVRPGESFNVPNKSGSTIVVTITDACGAWQKFEFHASCSDLWDIGDEFGSLTTQGGVGPSGFVGTAAGGGTLSFSATGCTAPTFDCSEPLDSPGARQMGEEPAEDEQVGLLGEGGEVENSLKDALALDDVSVDGDAVTPKAEEPAAE
jgi:hypothetical protein